MCPHGGGVGLCEYIQHISIFDYICVSASLENRLEFVLSYYTRNFHMKYFSVVCIVSLRALGFLLPRKKTADCALSEQVQFLY